MPQQLKKKKTSTKNARKLTNLNKPDAKGEENPNAYTMSQAAMSLMHLP